MTMHKTDPAAADATRRLAEFASALQFERLPSDVVAKAKTSILDTLGCCLFGATLASVRRLAAMVSEDIGDGPSQVLGLPQRTSPSHAALVNGTSAHAFQLDEIHIGATLHPGATSVPAVLALAEAGRYSGRDAITAVVAGAEIGIRVGMACKGGMFTRGYHNQGTTGALVAGAAAGRLLGLDAGRMRHALGIAGSQAAGLMAVQEGAMAKGFHSGRAAQSGVYAARLAALDYTGIPDVLEAPYGGFMSTLVGDYAGAELAAELGTRWDILSVGYKPAPASNGSITAMSAIDRIMRDHALEADDIREVTAYVSTNTLHHCGWHYDPAQVQGVLAAQMNLCYGMAVMALRRKATADEFNEQTMRDPAVLDFIRRVRVALEPRYDASGGKLRVACRAVVVTRDGRTLEVEVLYRKGTPEDPMTHAELDRKFVELACKTIGVQAAREIAGAVAELERMESTETLTRMLSEAVRAHARQ
ncbi:MAG: MmgE/PrpD family protein [Rhodospirillaceae bacterium]